MNSGRFEALIDAVVAIIITIIVLEIPLAASGTWESLFELRLEFITYVVSFIVCFSFWNYHQNIFSIVNKVNYKILWINGIGLLILSFLPYFTIFVANNFYSLVAQSFYGLDYLLIVILNNISSIILKREDKGNIALQIGVDTRIGPLISYIIIGIGYIIGFLFYPPAIIFSCLFALFASIHLYNLYKKIKN